MRRIETRLPDLVLLEPTVHGDERGFFVETWRTEWLPDVRFVQANHSRSSRGVLRGMHFQIGEGIAKLVRCGRGRILDVAVDVRPDSPTFGQWEAHELDDETHRQLFVPVGFAHGFCVLSDVADVLYQQDGYYDPEAERGINPADPEVGIEWPDLGGFTVSEKDQAAPPLAELRGEIHFSR